jgi:thiosulfate/3-mercaptopyruvate sulfurtransferase
MTQEGFVNPELLANTAWLAEHLNDPNLVVVDTDVAAGYARGHIPGAVLVPDNFEKDPDTDRTFILAPDKFAAMAEALGIGDDSLVVAYDSVGGLTGARLWWCLNYYGHTNVKVLDGGWRKWVNEGRPVSFQRPQPRSGVKFTANPDSSIHINGDQLIEEHNKPNVVPWDVRSMGEYTGEETRGNKRSGHIPGAVHMEWLQLHDPETHELKSPAELRRMLEENGITRDKTIVPH